MVLQAVQAQEAFTATAAGVRILLGVHFDDVVSQVVSARVRPLADIAHERAGWNLNGVVSVVPGAAAGATAAMLDVTVAVVVEHACEILQANGALQGFQGGGLLSLLQLLVEPRMEEQLVAIEVVFPREALEAGFAAELVS